MRTLESKLAQLARHYTEGDVEELLLRVEENDGSLPLPVVKRIRRLIPRSVEEDQDRCGYAGPHTQP